MPSPEYENFSVMFALHFGGDSIVIPNWELWAEMISKYQLAKNS